MMAIDVLLANQLMGEFEAFLRGMWPESLWGGDGLAAPICAWWATRLMCEALAEEERGLAAQEKAMAASIAIARAQGPWPPAIVTTEQGSRS